MHSTYNPTETQQWLCGRLDDDSYRLCTSCNGYAEDCVSLESGVRLCSDCDSYYHDPDETNESYEGNYRE